MSISAKEMEERLKELEYRIYEAIRKSKEELEEIEKESEKDIMDIASVSHEIRSFENMKRKINIMRNKMKNNSFTDKEEEELEDLEWFFDEDWD